MRSRRCLVGNKFLSVLEHRGERETVLLIHGNSSCKEVFAKQIGCLVRQGYGLVVPDLPGHGESDDAAYPPRDYSFPGYAAVLKHLMARSGHANYHIVGWSLGGHIGVEIWATDPHAAALLIVGTPPVSLDPRGIAAGFHWTPTTALAGRQTLTRQDARRYLAGMMGKQPPLSGPLEQAVTRTDGRARRWMVANGMRGIGVNELHAVSAIDKPLAVVHGACDPFVRQDHLTSIRYRNIRSGAPIILRAGHAPHWEAPDSFNAEMISFLRSVQ